MSQSIKKSLKHEKVVVTANICQAPNNDQLPVIKQAKSITQLDALPKLNFTSCSIKDTNAHAPHIHSDPKKLFSLPSVPGNYQTSISD